MQRVLQRSTRVLFYKEIPAWAARYFHLGRSSNSQTVKLTLLANFVQVEGVVTVLQFGQLDSFTVFIVDNFFTLFSMNIHAH